MPSAATRKPTGHATPGIRTAVRAGDALVALLRRAGVAVSSTARKLDGLGSGLPAQAAIGTAVGRSAAGTRAAALVEGTELASVYHAVSRSAADHIPFVVHHRSRARGTTGYEGHSTYYALRDSGCFLLFAADPQEVLDLGIIAHRIAERSLVPGVCSQDVFGHPGEVVTVRPIDDEVLAEYLGTANETIETPTPSQQLLFGTNRRRIPRLVDLDRPAGVGADLDAMAESRFIAGQDVFFIDHVRSIAEESFREFGRLTGREYEPVATYRTDDARHVIVVQGATARPAHAAVDVLRAAGHRVGMITVRMLRPFPGADVCRLLEGKKGVTVLESVHRGFAENPPLVAEIRASLDRAVENGAAGPGPPPYPEFPRLERPGDRPSIFSAICPSGSETHVSDLVAAFENMLPGGAAQREINVGVSFSRTATRIPVLERLSQLLESAYAGIGRLGLKGSRNGSRTSANAMAIFGSADQGLDLITGVLARSIFDERGWSVASASTRAVGEHRFEPTGWHVRHSTGTDEPPPAATSQSLVTVLQPHALLDHQVLDSLADDGTLVLANTARDDEYLRSLPRRALERLQERPLRVRTVDAAAIAESLSEDRWVRRQLAAHAAAGASLASYQPLEGTDPESLSAIYGRNLKELWTVGGELLDPCLQAFEQGLRSVRDIAPPDLGAVEESVEPTAPWTVREAPTRSESVFDAGRFWNSVGYLYETGQRDEVLSDPYAASGLVPARTSAFRSWEPYRTEIPSFLPENCTACGACFVACPDAALPATIFDLATLVETTLKKAETASSPLMQLRRVQKHLVRQAHRLAAGDARHVYRTASDLLRAAFEELAPRLGQSDDDISVLRSEVDTLASSVGELPIARTKTFFDGPEKNEKGSGLLFSITINPDACKACGICSNVCPDNALEIVRQTSDRIATYRENWNFAARLGSPSAEMIDAFIDPARPDSLANRLLDRRAYHSMVGGDSSFPGSGAQATLHVISALADAVVRPRMDRFVASLADAADRLEQKIRNQLRDAVDINDFEAFGRRLESLTGRTLEPEALAGLAAGDVKIDRSRLERMNTALLELRDVARAYEGAETGSRRSGMAGVFGDNPFATNRGYYPYNPFSFPWINTSADPVAVADGIFESASEVIISGLRALRRASLVLDDVYDPTEHDPEIESLSWRRLTADEWALCPPVCVIVSDAAQAAPYLMHVEAPVKVFLLSGELSALGSTSDVRLWPLARPDLFVLRSTIGVRGHLLAGVTRGLERRGPSLFQLYVGEPSEHGYDPAESATRMRQAVESRTFPLMTYDPDAEGEWAHRWSLDGNPSMDRDWHPHHKNEDRGFTPADWAIGEGRFRPYFRHVPRSRWTEAMCSLEEFIEMDAEAQEEKHPYIEVPLGSDRTARMQVSPEAVRLVKRSIAEWRLLQEFAGVRSSLATRIGEEAEARFREELERIRESLRADFEAKAARTRDEFGEEFHTRLTEELLALSGFGPDAAAAALRLSEYLAAAGDLPNGLSSVDEPTDTNGTD